MPYISIQHETVVKKMRNNTEVCTDREATPLTSASHISCRPDST